MSLGERTAEIVHLHRKAEKSGDGTDDAWKRRLALQIVTQLPEKPADALAVLALAQELVSTFLLSGGA